MRFKLSAAIIVTLNRPPNAARYAAPQQQLGATAVSPLWNKTLIAAADEICLAIVRRKTFQSTALPY
jgi:hypothetical protein